MAVEGTFNGATQELPLLWHSQISHVGGTWGSSSHKEATYPEVMINPESSDFPDGGCQRLKVALGSAYGKKAKIPAEINWHWVNAGNA